MTDETDIKIASQTCLSVSKDKDLELDEVEREILRAASKLLGECC